MHLTQRQKIRVLLIVAFLVLIYLAQGYTPAPEDAVDTPEISDAPAS